ncbi:MAG: Ppx/GppA family phosphatase [Polyangiaceae bacterium]|nr:Ppx/GppA family phosphatase [Polyangiaceae bacterium]
MRVAAIDIGTNTVLLLVAETNDAGELVAVQEHATITRLGEGVDKTRVLAPAAIARTKACLERYAEIVTHAEVDCAHAHVAVVGTSAMRDAEGAEAIGDYVAEKFGTSVRILSGVEEAQLTFAGALSGLPAAMRNGHVAVFDIGGGSTEVVYGNGGARSIAFAKSFNVGSVRLTERHVRSDPPNAENRNDIFRVASDAFASVPLHQASEPPVGIAGTMTTLAAVALGMTHYDGARVHGLRLTVAELERVVSNLSSVPLEERKRTAGLDPKRADVIVAGGLVALAFLMHVGAREVTISDRGVRWGLAEELARR